MQLKEFTLMLLVGKSVFTGIYLNAVEGVYSHAACRKVCFLRVFLSMQLKEFTLMLLVGKSVFMGIYLNAVI